MVNRASNVVNRVMAREERQASHPLKARTAKIWFARRSKETHSAELGSKQHGTHTWRANLQNNTPSGWLFDTFSTRPCMVLRMIWNKTRWTLKEWCPSLVNTQFSLRTATSWCSSPPQTTNTKTAHDLELWLPQDWQKYQSSQGICNLPQNTRKKEAYLTSSQDQREKGSQLYIISTHYNPQSYANATKQQLMFGTTWTWCDGAQRCKTWCKTLANVVQNV